MLPNHTFVILAYKDSIYIEECIMSIVNQKGSNSEIIMTTSTPSKFLNDISEKYNIKMYINTRKNNYITTDMNFALQTAKTKFVTLVHQDDVYLENYVENIDFSKDFLIRFTNYKELRDGNIINNNLLLWIKRLILLPFLFKNNMKSQFIKFTCVAFGNAICCPSVTYNRERLNDFLFDESFKVSLDWEAWLRISKMEGSFYYIKKPLILHRIHKDSTTSYGIKENIRYNEDVKILTSIWGQVCAKFIMYFYQRSMHSNK